MQRVGVFPGSFDPWNSGHSKALQYALETENWQRIVIVPTKQCNPNGATHQQRCVVLSSVFHEHPIVCIETELDYGEWLKKQQGVHVVGICGTSTKILPDEAVSEWICTNPKPSPSSSVSSMIRQTLAVDTMFFLKPHLPSELERFMEQFVIYWIRRNLLYIEATFQRKIETLLQQKIHGVGQIRLLPLQQSTQGLSGAYVFQAKTAASVYYVKLFTGEHAQDQLAAEIAGAQALDRVVLRIHSRGAQIFGSVQCDEWDIAVSLKINGCSLLDILLDGNVSLAREVCCEVGLAYAELHVLSKKKTDGTAAKAKLNVDYVSKVKVYLSKIKDTQFQTTFEHLLARLDQDAVPLQLCTTHGDAAPGNVIYDGDCVTPLCLLDLATVCDGTGFAEYEYHQFYTSLPWVCKMRSIPLTSEQVQQLQQAFHQGYTTIQPKFAQSPLFAFFEFFWRARDASRS